MDVKEDCTTMDELPDEWIPLRDWEGNVDGATFLKPQCGGGVSIIRYNDSRENDVIGFFSVEIPDLVEKLVRYQAGEF